MNKITTSAFSMVVLDKKNLYNMTFFYVPALKSGVWFEKFVLN